MSDSKKKGTKKYTVDPKKFRATVNELIESERDYVRDLQHLIEIFKEPANDLGLLSSEEFGEIFSNIDQIYRIHTKLLRYLEVYEASGERNVPIGKSFLTSVGNLVDPYKTFCTHHQKSVTTLERVRHENMSFAEFLEDARSIEETGNLNLESYLIKPVQRICKYPLLFKQLIKYTPKSNPDIPDLVTALEQIQAINEYVNEDLKVKMDEDEVRRLERNIDGLDRRIAEKGRRLIHHGTLMKVKNKRTEERHLFVFNNLCIYGKSAGGGGTRYKAKYCVSIDELIIMKDEDGFTMTFMSSKNKKSNHATQFKWRDATERKEWSKVFEVAMGDADDEKGERKWFSRYRNSSSFKERSSKVYRYSLTGDGAEPVEMPKDDKTDVPELFTNDQSGNSGKGFKSNGKAQIPMGTPPSLHAKSPKVLEKVAGDEKFALKKKDYMRSKRSISTDIYQSDDMLKNMEDLQLERASPRLRQLVKNLQKENEKLRSKLKYEIDQGVLLRDKVKKLSTELEEEKVKRIEMEKKTRVGGKRQKNDIFI